MRKASQEAQEKKTARELEEFLQAPRHDTGNAWYMILSFLLPIPGLIAAYIFRRINYIRNYKVCKKGAITGLITVGVIMALFLLLLLLAVI